MRANLEHDVVFHDTILEELIVHRSNIFQVFISVNFDVYSLLKP